MATAGAVRAAKGASQAPARSARPCSATASRSAGGAGAKTSPRPLSPAPALKTRGVDMTGHDPEIEELRDKVHCAVVLERTPPPWKPEGEHEAQPEIPAWQGRDPDRQPWRQRLVGSHQRRQGRCLRSGPKAGAG